MRDRPPNARYPGFQSAGASPGYGPPTAGANAAAGRAPWTRPGADGVFTAPASRREVAGAAR